MNKQTLFALVIALVLVGGVALLGSRDGMNTGSHEQDVKANLTASLETNPETVTAGVPAELAFTLEDKDGNTPDLKAHHARILHTLIIGEDMQTVAHLHPEDFGDIVEMKESGTYSVRFTFPKAGTYLVGIDAMDASGAFSQQFTISVSGNDALSRTQDSIDTSGCFSGYREDGEDRYTEAVIIAEKESCADAYHVTFSHVPKVLKSGEPVSLQFGVEQNGQPVTKLEPYLDAALHLAIVPEDMSTLMHAHGTPEGSEVHQHSGLIPVAHAHEGEMDEMMMHHNEELPEAFGPNLVSDSIVFPEEGKYYIFGQFKHEGKIVFTRFAVDVEKGIYSSEQFEHLSAQTTNSCGGGKAVVFGLPEDGRLQGSCCGPMNMHSYQEQTAGLKAKYSEYDIIPADPYDVPVVWARQMIEYGEQTILTSEQQTIYDEAVEVSGEGGPCCCVCWHWYAYEGLAKHLIINEGFSAEQIAEVWDLSDACGGDNHRH